MNTTCPGRHATGPASITLQQLTCGSHELEEGDPNAKAERVMDELNRVARLEAAIRIGREHFESLRSERCDSLHPDLARLAMVFLGWKAGQVGESMTLEQAEAASGVFDGEGRLRPMFGGRGGA